MKHFNLFLRAFLALTISVSALTSCDELFNTEVNDPEQSEKTTIHASTERTRTTLEDDLSVRWQESDFIKLFGTYHNYNIFELTEGIGSSSASFIGTIPVTESDFIIATYGEIAHTELNRVAVGGVFFQLSPVQIYQPGTFGQYTNPMIGLYDTENQSIAFQNVCGILRIDLTGEKTIREIALSAEDNAYQLHGLLIAGMEATGDLWNSVSTNGGNGVENDGSTANTLRLIDINCLLTSEAQSFYFVIPPGIYENLKITITDNEGGSMTRTATKPVTVNRNDVLPLTALNYEPDTPTLMKAWIDLEGSSWMHLAYQTEMLEGCSKYKICDLSGIEYWLDKDPSLASMTLEEVIDSKISHEYTENRSGVFGIWDLHEGEHTVYVLPYDAEGNFSKAIELNYTAPSPYDDSLTISAEMQEISDTSMGFSFDLGGEILYYSWILTTPEYDTDATIIQLIETESEWDGIASGGSCGEGVLDPATSYVLHILTRGADDRISQLYSLPFRTTYTPDPELTVSTRVHLFRNTDLNAYDPVQFPMESLIGEYTIQVYVENFSQKAVSWSIIGTSLTRTHPDDETIISKMVSSGPQFSLSEYLYYYITGISLNSPIALYVAVRDELGNFGPIEQKSATFTEEDVTDIAYLYAESSGGSTQNFWLKDVFNPDWE